MTRFILYVPEQYNDGLDIGECVFEIIENDILAASGGFTLTHGIGAYRGDGTSYREPVRLYTTDSDDPEVPGKLHALARRVRVALKQEAVKLDSLPIGTSLITALTA